MLSIISIFSNKVDNGNINKKKNNNQIYSEAYKKLSPEITSKTGEYQIFTKIENFKEKKVFNKYQINKMMNADQFITLEPTNIVDGSSTDANELCEEISSNKIFENETTNDIDIDDLNVVNKINEVLNDENNLRSPKHKYLVSPSNKEINKNEDENENEDLKNVNEEELSMQDINLIIMGGGVDSTKESTTTTTASEQHALPSTSSLLDVEHTKSNKNLIKLNKNDKKLNDNLDNKYSDIKIKTNKSQNKLKSPHLHDNFDLDNNVDTDNQKKYSNEIDLNINNEANLVLKNNLLDITDQGDLLLQKPSTSSIIVTEQKTLVDSELGTTPNAITSILTSQANINYHSNSSSGYSSSSCSINNNNLKLTKSPSSNSDLNNINTLNDNHNIIIINDDSSSEKQLINNFLDNKLTIDNDDNSDKVNNRNIFNCNNENVDDKGFKLSQLTKTSEETANISSEGEIKVNPLLPVNLLTQVESHKNHDLIVNNLNKNNLITKNKELLTTATTSSSEELSSSAASSTSSSPLSSTMNEEHSSLRKQHHHHHHHHNRHNQQQQPQQQLVESTSGNCNQIDNRKVEPLKINLNREREPIKTVIKLHNPDMQQATPSSSAAVGVLSVTTTTPATALSSTITTSILNSCLTNDINTSNVTMPKITIKPIVKPSGKILLQQSNLIDHQIHNYAPASTSYHHHQGQTLVVPRLTIKTNVKQQQQINNDDDNIINIGSSSDCDDGTDDIQSSSSSTSPNLKSELKTMHVVPKLTIRGVTTASPTLNHVDTITPNNASLTLNDGIVPKLTIKRDNHNITSVSTSETSEIIPKLTIKPIAEPPLPKLTIKTNCDSNDSVIVTSSSLVGIKSHGTSSPVPRLTIKPIQKPSTSELLLPSAVTSCKHQKMFASPIKSDCESSSSSEISSSPASGATSPTQTPIPKLTIKPIYRQINEDQDNFNLEAATVPKLIVKVPKDASSDRSNKNAIDNQQIGSVPKVTIKMSDHSSGNPAIVHHHITSHHSTSHYLSSTSSSTSPSSSSTSSTQSINNSEQIIPKLTIRPKKIDDDQPIVIPKVTIKPIINPGTNSSNTSSGNSGSDTKSNLLLTETLITPKVTLKPIPRPLDITQPLEIVTTQCKIMESSGQDSPRIILKINKSGQVSTVDPDKREIKNEEVMMTLNDNCKRAHGTELSGYSSGSGINSTSNSAAIEGHAQSVNSEIPMKRARYQHGMTSSPGESVNKKSNRSFDKIEQQQHILDIRSGNENNSAAGSLLRGVPVGGGHLEHNQNIDLSPFIGNVEKLITNKDNNLNININPNKKMKSTTEVKEVTSKLEESKLKLKGILTRMQQTIREEAFKSAAAVRKENSIVATLNAVNVKQQQQKNVADTKQESLSLLSNINDLSLNLSVNDKVDDCTFDHVLSLMPKSTPIASSSTSSPSSLTIAKPIDNDTGIITASNELLLICNNNDDNFVDGGDDDDDDSNSDCMIVDESIEDPHVDGVSSIRKIIETKNNVGNKKNNYKNIQKIFNINNISGNSSCSNNNDKYGGNNNNNNNISGSGNFGGGAAGGGGNIVFSDKINNMFIDMINLNDKITSSTITTTSSSSTTTTSSSTTPTTIIKTSTNQNDLLINLCNNKITTKNITQIETDKQSQHLQPQQQEDDDVSATPTPIKRKRGRPRKINLPSKQKAQPLKDLQQQQEEVEQQHEVKQHQSKQEQQQELFQGQQEETENIGNLFLTDLMYDTEPILQELTTEDTNISKRKRRLASKKILNEDEDYFTANNDTSDIMTGLSSNEFLNEDDHDCPYLDFSLDGENNVDCAVDGSSPKKILYNDNDDEDDDNSPTFHLPGRPKGRGRGRGKTVTTPPSNPLANTIVCTPEKTNIINLPLNIVSNDSTSVPTPNPVGRPRGRARGKGRGRGRGRGRPPGSTAAAIAAALALRKSLKNDYIVNENDSCSYNLFNSDTSPSGHFNDCDSGLNIESNVILIDDDDDDDDISQIKKKISNFGELKIDNKNLLSDSDGAGGSVDGIIRTTLNNDKILSPMVGTATTISSPQSFMKLNKKPQLGKMIRKMNKANFLKYNSISDGVSTVDVTLSGANICGTPEKKIIIDDVAWTTPTSIYSNDFNKDSHRRKAVLRETTTPALQVFEEDTRMSADLQHTPISRPIDYLNNEESQSSFLSSASVTLEGSSTAIKKQRGRMEVRNVGGAEFTVDMLAEYEWPPPINNVPSRNRDLFMIQEQIAEYLGVKSFKRKYPDLARRSVDMEERNYLRENRLVSEKMCDLGLTAVNASDILDIMYQDFNEKYEFYKKYHREKQAREFSLRQKALKSEPVDKCQLARDKALKSASNWNCEFNKGRKDTRRACMDLQNLIIQLPKIKRLAKTQNNNNNDSCNKGSSNYPIALVPGQFSEFYRQFSPQELRCYPINTVLIDPMKLFKNKNYLSSSSSAVSSSSSSGSSSSGSSSSSSSSSSSTSSSDEDDVNLSQLNLNEANVRRQEQRQQRQQKKRIRDERRNKNHLLMGGGKSAPRSNINTSDSNTGNSSCPSSPESSESSDDDETISRLRERSLQSSTTPISVNKKIVTTTPTLINNLLKSPPQDMQTDDSATANCLQTATSAGILSTPQPNTCRVCSKPQNSNRDNRPERFIKCSTCRRKAHPSCIEMSPRMVRRALEYSWQCSECKHCCKCRRTTDEDKMLFCDQCDRGYHIYCVGLRNVPEGRWHCSVCSICTQCGTRNPEGHPNPNLSQIQQQHLVAIAQWQHEYRVNHVTKLREHCAMLCTPCARLKTVIQQQQQQQPQQALTNLEQQIQTTATNLQNNNNSSSSISLNSNNLMIGNTTPLTSIITTTANMQHQIPSSIVTINNLGTTSTSTINSSNTISTIAPTTSGVIVIGQTTIKKT